MKNLPSRHLEPICTSNHSIPHSNIQPDIYKTLDFNTDLLVTLKKLCNAISHYDVSKQKEHNIIAAQQALSLVHTGAVTGIGTDCITFHTIGKSLYTKPISMALDPTAWITARPVFKDILGNTHWENGVWYDQTFLDDDNQIKQLINNINDAKSYIATYDTFFSHIYNMLAWSDYIRRRTFQLLTNINDIVIMDIERYEKKRHFWEFSYYHAFVKPYGFDSCNWSLYMARDYPL